VDPNAYEALVRRREARIADDARIPGAGFKHASGTAAFGSCLTDATPRAVPGTPLSRFAATLGPSVWH